MQLQVGQAHFTGTLVSCINRLFIFHGRRRCGKLGESAAPSRKNSKFNAILIRDNFIRKMHGAGMNDENSTERNVKGSSSKDITPLLKGWDYEPGTINVRKVTGLDGTPKLQMRQDLGLLQM